jgi:CHAT domain-containing protein
MKRFFFNFIIILTTISNVIAQDISPNITSFMEYYGKDDILGMDRVAFEIINLAPDNYAGYAFKAYTSILKNDIETAEKYMSAARNINPVDQGSYGISSYIAFLKGNLSEAKKLMEFSFQVRADETLLQVTLDDISKIEKATKKDLSELKTLAENANANTKDSPAIMQKFYGCFQNWNSGNECADIAVVNNYFEKQQPQNVIFSANAEYFKAMSFYFAQNYEGAKKAFTSFVDNPKLQKNEIAYNIAQSYYYLSFYEDYNPEILFLNADKGLNALQKIAFPTLLKCQLMHRKIIALGNLGKKEEKMKLAEQLLVEAKKLSFPYMEAQANNTLGSYYLVDVRPDKRQKANAYLAEAYKIATELNDEDLINIVTPNYALSYWQMGNKQEAIKMISRTYENLVKKQQFSDAQLIANNLAYMSFMQNDFSNAAQMFKKAVSITEKYRENLSSAQQLTMMNEHSSAYSGLISSLQKLNNVSELFEAQDLNRSRLLRDKLNKNATSKTLVEAQKMLDSDEVLLYYSEVGAGEMVVSVITNSSASIGYNFPIDSWLVVKKDFVNLIKQKPNTFNNYVLKMDEEVIDGKIIKYKDKAQAFSGDDYSTYIDITQQLLNDINPEMKSYQEKVLHQWYNFLIKPIESKIAGKKTLIISGEGFLNYLPFETFLDSQNKYLIESYNVKYIPSVTVWATLQDRNYSDNRKPILAMGGATYNPPPPEGFVPPSISIETYFALHDAIDKKIKANESDLSRELTALQFGGANFLQGTLAEVQALQQIIPDGTILIGDDMRESNFKSLDKANELANYKWIHLATHGFATDDIPELSGVMMTQPPGGDGKEDQFLLAHEIAKLNLKADMAVLSACSTALGKIYGGEGVNGLNSAFLTAGANNTLLSLWPVSDAGTKLFMILVYDYLYTQKMTAEDAVNIAKRDMLTGKYGEVMAEPSIWAPFVLNGK